MIHLHLNIIHLSKLIYLGSILIVSSCFSFQPSTIHAPYHSFTNDIFSHKSLSKRHTYLLSSSFSNDHHNNNSSDDDSKTKTICILGGGFGGLTTALNLDSYEWPTNQKIRIVLVDKKERFVFLPLLYELCVDDAELEEVAPTYSSLLRNSKNISFVQKEVHGIDIDSRFVYLSPSSARQNIEKIKYDVLVVATGADMNLSSTSGASKYAIPFYSIEDCYELRKQLALLDTLHGQQDGDNNRNEKEEEPLKVVVVGGGYSGVELALNVKERLKQSGNGVDVTIVHRGDELLQYATDYNRKVGQDRVMKAGINVMTNSVVREILPCVNDEEPNKNQPINERKCKVLIGSKSSTEVSKTLDADLLLWTAGASSTNIQRGILNSKLPRDNYGRIVTSNVLCVQGTNDVFALGDCSRAKKVPYGATAQVALQQGAVVSWNAYVTLLDKMRSENHNVVGGRRDDLNMKMLPFNYIDLGEMMTLGTNDATISSLQGLVQISGPTASILRRLIYAVRMPTTQQALSAATLSTEKRLENSLKRKIIDWK